MENKKSNNQDNNQPMDPSPIKAFVPIQPPPQADTENITESFNPIPPPPPQTSQEVSTSNPVSSPPSTASSDSNQADGS